MEVTSALGRVAVARAIRCNKPLEFCFAAPGALSAEASGSAHHWARRLIELANDRDGNDNISVSLIRIRDVERVGMYRGRPYKLR